MLGSVQAGLRALAAKRTSRAAQEEDRVVIIRFGHDYDETCMQMDEVQTAASCCCTPPPPPPAPPPPALCCPSTAADLTRLQILAGTAERMKNFAVIYLVDISQVPDFNAMYELYDPCTVMFFFRNKVRRHQVEACKAGLHCCCPSERAACILVFPRTLKCPF